MVWGGLGTRLFAPGDSVSPFVHVVWVHIHVHIRAFVSCYYGDSVHSVENIPRYTANTVGVCDDLVILSGYAHTHET